MVRASKSGRTGRATGLSKDTEQGSECQKKHGNTVTSSPKGLPKTSIELQQRVLNVFRDAFVPRVNHELPQLLQEVKKNLFNRDFRKAFGGEAFLETYASRWSPSRALAYMEIFCSISPLPIRLTRSFSDTTMEVKEPLASGIDSANPLLSDAKAEVRPEKEQQSHLPPPNDPAEGFGIVCLGGGSGAELVALVGYLRWMRSANHDSQTKHDTAKKTQLLNIKVLDIADWSNIIHKIHSVATTTPPISPYAATALKANNTPLADPTDLRIHFQHADILSLTLDQLKNVFKRDTKLVTIMFTLNELYTSSMSATTNLLLSITSILTPGALLLVVDSPGSYSTVDIIGNRKSEGAGAGVGAGTGTGATENDDEDADASASQSRSTSASAPKKNEMKKKYPMHWLLDHTLLESANIASSGTARVWQKVYTHESTWFRLKSELKYPIELEDMRYQIHLYERL